MNAQQNVSNKNDRKYHLSNYILYQCWAQGLFNIITRCDIRMTLIVPMHSFYEKKTLGHVRGLYRRMSKSRNITISPGTSEMHTHISGTVSYINWPVCYRLNTCFKHASNLQVMHLRYNRNSFQSKANVKLFAVWSHLELYTHFLLLPGIPLYSSLDCWYSLSIYFFPKNHCC